MPQIRKLAVEEVQALNNKGKGQRKLVEEEYDTLLSEYAAGDYGEAYLEPGENRLTIRNRLRAAIQRRSLALEFKRTSEELIRFKVVEQAHSPENVLNTSDELPEVISSDTMPKQGRGRSKVAAAPASGKQPAPKTGGGRPKKTA